MLAERLARAALQAGAGFRAELALGRALAGAGRGAEADARFAALAARARDDRERAEVAVARARNLFWALDRADDADAALRGAERVVRDAALRHELAAQRARLTAAHGRPAAALAAARPLLDDPGVDERARTTAAMGAVEALFTSGRDRRGGRARRGPGCRSRAGSGTSCRRAEPVLLGMGPMALRLAGRLTEATAASERAYAQLLARRSATAIAVEANSLGLIWLARGRVRTALRFCRESAALLRDADPVGMLAFALAGVGQAAAQAGEPGAARAAVAELERTALGHKAFAVELELARAWGAAAHGELTRARALARDAARAGTVTRPGRLRACGRCTSSAGSATPRPRRRSSRSWRAASTGRTPRRRPRTRPRSSPATGAPCRRSPSGSRRTARCWSPSRRRDAAAAAHRETGRQASARAAAARAGLWLAECEGARPPTLLAAPDAAGLTAREREVALLAAAGSSSREIAAQLVVSVRTVDNHLQNAYRKLGVTRRQELPGVLTPPAPPLRRG